MFLEMCLVELMEGYFPVIRIAEAGINQGFICGKTLQPTLFIIDNFCTSI